MDTTRFLGIIYNLMNSKITFMIVGAPRSGTTTLYNCLQQHPEIFLPKMKEPHYFSGVSALVNSFDTYNSLFEDVKFEKAVGEASSSYLLVPETAQRIFDTFGSIKIIIMLRNPVDRAFSNWLLTKTHRNIENLDFEAALEIEEDRFMHKNDLEFWPGYMYFRTGLYFEQVKRYIDIFGSENVKVIIFEDFIEQPQKYCQNVYHFLNVAPGFMPEVKNENKVHKPRFQFLYDFISPPPPHLLKLYHKLPDNIQRAIYRIVSGIHRANRQPIIKQTSISTQLRKTLNEKYFPDIKKLERLLDRDLSFWLDENSKNDEN